MVFHIAGEEGGRGQRELGVGEHLHVPLGDRAEQAVDLDDDGAALVLVQRRFVDHADVGEVNSGRSGHVGNSWVVRRVIRRVPSQHGGRESAAQPPTFASERDATHRFAARNNTLSVGPAAQALHPEQDEQVAPFRPTGDVVEKPTTWCERWIGRSSQARCLDHRARRRGPCRTSDFACSRFDGAADRFLEPWPM